MRALRLKLDIEHALNEKDKADFEAVSLLKNNNSQSQVIFLGF